MTAATAEKTKAAPATAPAEPTARKAPKGFFDLNSIAPVTAPRKASKKFSACIYAPKGVGKTSILGSVSEVEAISPILIMAAEDGTSVLAETYPNADVVTVEDYDTAAKIITAVANGETHYKTFAIDTFSELQELMKDKTTNNGATSMEFKDWGYIADESTKVAKLLHRTPHVNFLFTSHAEKVKDESTGKMLVSPVFLGKKSLAEVLKPIDLVLYMNVAKTDSGTMRVLQTKPDGKNDAADRTGKLEEYIEEPTFAKIYAQLTA